ncbi:MAG: Glutamyl-tRNA(Gln) amidotransferase subunit [Pseudomonadota bacterium]
MLNNAFIEQFILPPNADGNLRQLKFSVKDCIDVAGFVNSFGNPTWRAKHLPAITNAICVNTMLNNGAICLGKVICDEFTYSLLGENVFYGSLRNNLSPERVTGGSSSGSAVSVADGLVDFSLATDTLGSVRVPAANCGIYGYRPSWGIIPVSGVLPLAISMDTVGVLARNFEVLDKVAMTLNPASINANVNKEAKYVVVSDLVKLCTNEVQIQFYAYLNRMQIKYTTIELANYLSLNDCVLALYLRDLVSNIQAVEIWAQYGLWIENIKPELGPIAAYNFSQIAQKANNNEIDSYIVRRNNLKLILQSILVDTNIVLIPTIPDLPPYKGLYTRQPQLRVTAPYFINLIALNSLSSLSGLPQITLPCFENKQVSVSFIASQNQDQWLFSQIKAKFNSINT